MKELSTGEKVAWYTGIAITALAIATVLFTYLIDRDCGMGVAIFLNLFYPLLLLISITIAASVSAKAKWLALAGLIFDVLATLWLQCAYYSGPPVDAGPYLTVGNITFILPQLDAFVVYVGSTMLCLALGYGIGRGIHSLRTKYVLRGQV